MNSATATSETLAVSAGACLLLSEAGPNICGDDGLAGGICQPVHNIRNDSANTARLVFIDINRSGVARLFQFISFHAG